MIDQIQSVFGLLVAMVVLAAIARAIRVPYPILLVVGGLVIALTGIFPPVELQPEIVFLIFLPPILQMGGWTTQLRDFRANINAIGLLAIGLVLATMAAVAVVVHTIIPQMPWAAAFVLGAIVAPPDAVAASSIAQRLKLPRRIVTVLEGESLLNDASALVALRVALAAVGGAAFDALQAGGQFVLSGAGGVAVGIGLGFVLTPFFRLIRNDVPLYTIMTFLSGYIAYLLADRLTLSGVLAVVALGIFYTRYGTMTAELRVQTLPVWEVVVFLLNGLIFVLIGLQMRRIIESRALAEIGFTTLLAYAAAVCVTLIVVRLVWVAVFAYAIRLPPSVRSHDPFPPLRDIIIVGWTGMRGVVSLAAALALPTSLDSARGYPVRDMIIFLTFCVILVTLVVQGLSLPPLIRLLGVHDDGGGEREENKARLKAAHAGRRRIDEIAARDNLHPDLVAKLARQYDTRIRRYSGRYHGQSDDEAEEHLLRFARLEEEILHAEMDALNDLLKAGVINDEVLRRVQHDLDLELLRLHDIEPSLAESEDEAGARGQSREAVAGDRAVRANG